MFETGGGSPYNGLYREAPPERASGISKGRDFTSLDI